MTHQTIYRRVLLLSVFLVTMRKGYTQVTLRLLSDYRDQATQGVALLNSRIWSYIACIKACEAHIMC